MKKEEMMRKTNQLLHGLIFSLHMDHLGFWSEDLNDIQPVELHLMKMISETPDIIIGEIRSTLGVPGSTMSSIVNRLEKKGLLRRIISARDRRSYGLKLTPKGIKKQAEHERVDLLLAEKILGTLNDQKERERLIMLLSQVVQNLKPEKS
jgi:DNA-binding MarR family transcriptional regulator